MPSPSSSPGPSDGLTIGPQTQSGALTDLSSGSAPTSTSRTDDGRCTTNSENQDSIHPRPIVPPLVLPIEQSDEQSTPLQQQFDKRPVESVFQSEPTAECHETPGKTDRAYIRSRSDGNLFDIRPGKDVAGGEMVTDELKTVDNELYILGENSRLLRRNRTIQDDFDSKVGSFHRQIVELEERLEGTERQLSELQEQKETERAEWEEQRRYYETQVVQERKFTEAQSIEFEQQREEWLEENRQLQKAIEAHLNADLQPSASNSRHGSPLKERKTEYVQTEIDVSLQITVEELTEASTVRDQLAKQVEQLTQEKSQLEAELKGEISYLRHEMDVNKEIENDETKRQLEEVQGHVAELELQVEALHADKAMLSEQLQEQQYQNSILQMQLQELRCEKSVSKDVDQKCAQISHEIVQLRTELDERDVEIGALKTDLKRTKDECEKRKAEVDHLRSCLNLSNSNQPHEAPSIEEQLLETQQDCSRMREELERMQTRMLAVRDVQTAFEAQKLSSEQSAAQIREQEAEIQKLISEHKDLEQVFNQTLMEKKTADTHLLELKELLHQRDTDIDCLEREYECFKENAEVQFSAEKEHYEQQLANLNEQLSKYADYSTTNKPSAFGVADQDSQKLSQLLSSLADEHESARAVLNQIRNQQTTKNDASTNTDTRTLGESSWLDGLHLSLTVSKQTSEIDKSEAKDIKRQMSNSDKLKLVLAAVRTLFERVKCIPLVDEKSVNEEIIRLIEELKSIMLSSTDDSLSAKTLNNDLTRTLAHNAQLEGQIDELKTRLQTLTQQLTTRAHEGDARHDKARRTIVELQKRLSDSEETRNHQDRELDQYHRQLLELRDNLEQRDGEVAEMTTALKEAKGVVEEQNERLSEQRERFDALNVEAANVIHELNENYDRERQRANEHCEEATRLSTQCERLKRTLTGERMLDAQSRDIDAVVNDRWRHRENEWNHELSELSGRLRLMEMQRGMLIEQKRYQSYRVAKLTNDYQRLSERATKFIRDNLSEAELRSVISPQCRTAHHRSVIRGRWKTVLFALIWRNRPLISNHSTSANLQRDEVQPRRQDNHIANENQHGSSENITGTANRFALNADKQTPQSGIANPPGGQAMPRPLQQQNTM